MVKRMPTIDLITHDFLRFIEGEILVGHNINFDINFLYDSFSQSNLFITNDYIDTLRLARIIVNNSPDHQLLTLIEYFNIDNDYNSTDYRSELYLELYKKNFEENSIDTYKQRKKESRKKSDFSLITSSLDLEEIDNTNPFYDKYVCITGKLDFSTKTDLCKILANLGARNQNNVTKDTDYLILGNLRHQQQMYGDKSSKHKKVEKMISEGFNIEILTELSTKELIESYE
ncbi:exonuclease domain-containing protein [Erysipelothrix sp. Poltava]|nr:exonuclease domain-containing protein [Erysipelothrix sp. Poltava]